MGFYFPCSYSCSFSFSFSFSFSPLLSIPQPSLFGASLTSNIERCSSARTRSSLSILNNVSFMNRIRTDVAYRASTRTSSPSTCSEALGVRASRTKWLSQCGQYSSLITIQRLYNQQNVMMHLRILKLACILSEGLLALLAYEDHVKGLHERVVCGLLVAFCTVEPFLAWPGSALISCRCSRWTHSRASGWRLGR